jgi:hypothetical protein
VKTVVAVIPHADQRYPTIGDWVFGGDALTIAVSDTGDPKMNFLIGLHEQIEAMLCLERGIPEPEVMAFDRAHPELDEPGADPRAPYHAEHVFAEQIERLVAARLGVDWTEYERLCVALCRDD